MRGGRLIRWSGWMVRSWGWFVSGCRMVGRSRGMIFGFARFTTV